ncbi:MAG: hypothetical protein V7707_15320 [Motiliproteus sp.]
MNLPASDHPARQRINPASKLLASAALLLLLVGCSNVSTTVTSFHQVDASHSGTISVVAGTEELKDTLNFDHHRKLLEQYLSAQGYQVVPSPADNSPPTSDYTAFLSYGIDAGNTEVIADNSGMSVGIGVGASSAGRRHSAMYGSYRMPLYGSSAGSNSSETRYTSAIAVDIVDSASLNSDKPIRLYEGRARSSSSCAAITPIFNEMLTALFEDFPGVSGETQTIKVKSSGDSC